MASAPDPAAGPAPRQRDAERTRAEILAVATTVFARDGYSGARVDEIASITSTTKRMIYYYFGGKEQLYLTVLENAYAGVRTAEAALEVEGLDPVSAIRRLAELTYDYHHEHPDFIRLVSIENIHRGEFIRRLGTLRSVAHRAPAQIARILERGRAEDLFRTDVDEIDVHMVISSYCVFQVANRHTFDHLFGRDLGSEDLRPHHRAMMGDLVVAWLTRP